MKENYEKQVAELRGQLNKVLAKAQSAKMKQLRHMVCFVCSMADLVIAAFWLGASPQTSHWYYTFKVFLLVGFRAVWYGCLGWHYFLYDLCYYCNLILLVYVWFFPSNPELFMACSGFAGVLSLSVPVFRNSFVPHSLD